MHSQSRTLQGRLLASLLRRPLALTISSVLLGVMSSAAAVAQSFPASLNLGGLDGSDGFRLAGVAADDRSGGSLSAAGDINGDGLDDLIIGASGADPNGAQSGSSYVVFGRSTPLPATLGLSSLDGSNGFRLDGAAAGDNSGFAVSGLGDINGDGVDDLIVGAQRASPSGVGYAGSSYVVFGRSTPFAAAVNVSTLNGANGFRLDGSAINDQAGRRVSALGDFNGDGLADIVVGAPLADPSGQASGSIYVVFGRSTAFPATLALSSLDGTTGLRLDGLAAGELTGEALGAAGDVNGDGLDDLIIGSSAAGSNSGRAYVVFGRSVPGPAAISLSALDGSNGVRLNGAALDQAGFSVDGVGDLNADGLDDLIIGAIRGPAATGVGRAYVVYGRSTPFPATLSLPTLDGSDGLILDGVAAGNFAGFAVSSGGDVNGDGRPDLIVGAPGAAPNGLLSGSSYVMFGSSAPFASPIALSSLDGNNGFRLDGAVAGDYAGNALSAAGDINGDGVDDLLIGANLASPNGALSGSSYVVFGRDTSPDAADLSISLDAAPTLALLNQPVIVTAVSSNSGADDAQNLQITLTLSPSLQFASLVASSGGVCSAPTPGLSGQVDCNWTDPTAAGATRSVAVTVSGNTVGSASVLATTSSSTTDPTALNNDAQLSINVRGLALPIPTLGTRSLFCMGLLLGGLGLWAVRPRQ